jgi:dienelactone hydrolase
MSRECQGVRSLGEELSLVVYPEAAHSFDLDILPHRYLGNLIGKHPQAAEDSFKRMVAFFARYVRGRIS